MKLAAPLRRLALPVLLAGSAVAQAVPDPAPFLRLLAPRPLDVALVTYGVRPDGTPDPAQPAVFLNADLPMPLASVRKILVLAAYAREVSAGRLRPETTVTRAVWDRTYLEGTDGGAHPAALKRLGLDSPASATTLDAVAGAMMRESDNAAADLLLERVGGAALDAVMRDAKIREHDPLVSLLGEFLANPPRDTPRENFPALADEAARAYLNGARPAAPVSLNDQGRRAQTFSPRGTARDYARILAGVVSGTFLDAKTSEIMRRHLEWPARANPRVADAFDPIGSKGGSLVGVLNTAMYFRPTAGPAAGQPKVAVYFSRGVPLAEMDTRANAVETFLLLTAIRADFADRVRATLPGAEDR